jgi:DNA topoisomerase-1
MSGSAPTPTATFRPPGATSGVGSSTATTSDGGATATRQSTAELAALALREFEAVDSKAQAKKNVVRAIERVAERLGNTLTVCRKCYVHPEVINAYLDGSLLDTLRQLADQELATCLPDLRPEGDAMLGLLRQRLVDAADHKQKTSR